MSINVRAQHPCGAGNECERYHQGVFDAGVSKGKDKAALRKPATSPESGHSVENLHPHGAKSAQCSRSGKGVNVSFL